MSAATDYVQAGFALIPLRHGTKAPLIRDWTLKERAITTHQAALNLNGGGIGLAHAWSRTCAFDIDDFFQTIDWFTAKGVDVTGLLQHPAAVRINSGKPNHAKLIYRLPDGVEPLLSIKVRSDTGATVFEFRCADSRGQTVQCVLPPSIHPDTGKAYAWEGDWRKIPPLPDNLLAVWHEQIRINQFRTNNRFTSPGTLENLSDQTCDDLVSALAIIPSDDRDTWIAVGHALKPLGEYGRVLWESWSKKSRAYKPGDESRWETFDTKHSDYRSVFARASRHYGWANPGYRWPDGSETDHSGSVVDYGEHFIDVETFISTIKPPVWLVDRIIEQGCLYSLTAHTNHGKTALATTLAVSIASGLKFGLNKSTQGHVLYLCGENPENFKRRLAGTIHEMGLTPREIKNSLTIFDYGDWLTKISPALLDFCAKVEGVILIIIDTTVAYFPGDNENDNSQSRDHAKRMRDLIGAAGNPAIVTLSHTPKSAEAALEPRGGSGFIGEIDGNLTASLTGEIVELWHTKLRERGFDPVKWLLKSVPVPGLFDADNRQVETVVAVAISEEDAEKQSFNDSCDADDMIKAMYNNQQGSIAIWVASLGWFYSNGMPDKSRGNRAMKLLSQEKYVEQGMNKRFRITETKGEKYAKKLLNIK
jgi:hypothetical protein